ncbi:MAG: nitroreductase family protein [Burkholderiaceae bacterium]|nr:nitroreductase family protein [Burkholderiaceae bacterium]
MSNPIQQAIEARASANHYDPGRALSDADIMTLVEQATRAPSAYHFQNWKFIAVRTPEAKARLLTVSYGQQKVADASVTFIICGMLAAHEQLARSLEPCVRTGGMDQSLADDWVAQATRAHSGNPVLQRDEAIRSASLAAMTMMLAAQGMGLATGAMTGFDAERLSREFALPPTAVPAILITVGYPIPGNWPQKHRRPLHEVIAFA